MPECSDLHSVQLRIVGLIFIVSSLAILGHSAIASAEGLNAGETQGLDSLKQISLSDDGSWSATLGGELRERFEFSSHPVFGLGELEHNEYLLHRSLLSIDIRHDKDFRLFAELVNGFAPGWMGAAPPTQHDQLDLLQGFGEVSLPFGGDDVMLRVGRQEMSFGSSRLVSVREGPNIRRAFDGIRATWNAPDAFTLDAFLRRPVAPEEGIFSDASDGTQAFWGAYATTKFSPIQESKVDLYYLGCQREDARFAQGVATERRHTFGARLFGKRNGFDWNSEVALQLGTFGSSDIHAWTISSDVGYTFSGLPLSPRLGLNADAISGDDDLGDRTLGTSNPLFPKLPYFSEANLVAPANLLDIQPNLTLSFTPELKVNVGWNPLWKESKVDAFYAPPLSPVKGTDETDEGTGIPNDGLERVFDKFYRVKGVDGRSPGTGLGLAICRGIAKAMGGDIKAESPIANGRGTRIVVRIPSRALQ